MSIIIRNTEEFSRNEEDSYLSKGKYVTLYRGVKLSIERINEYMNSIGKITTMKGFISTTQFKE